MLRWVLALTAAPVLAFAAAGALAEDRVPSRVEVTLQNVDFGNLSEVKTVYARLYKAAQVVCDSAEAPEPFRVPFDRECERDAIDGAVHHLNKPLLNALNTRVEADPGRLKHETASDLSRN